MRKVISINISTNYLSLVVGLWLLCVTSSPALAGTYTASAHGASVTGRATGYATGNCAHCHDQHASRAGISHTPYPVLRGLAEEILCENCHDGGLAADNIESEFDKNYGHTYLDDNTYKDRHTISSTLEKNTVFTGSAFRGSKRHVECCDCHEPHTAQTGNHTAFTSGNAVSNALLGVWGVEPTSEAIWVPATAYTETNPATKEYQICFKCHSYYAFEVGSGVTTITSPSGIIITDQSKEFAKDNKSVHPVRVGLSSQTGSDAPKNIDTSQMVSPWNKTAGASGVGVQTMYCSDCHGNNTSTPVGPHGSTQKNMIIGPDNSEWPYNTARNRLWTLDDVYYNRNNVGTTLLCKKCHTMSITSSKFDNYVHDKHEGRDFKGEPWLSAYPKYNVSSTDSGYPCITCHIVVPHGSKRSRLIGYDSDPAPYTLNEGGSPPLTWPLIKGFKKVTDPFDTSTKDCVSGYDKGNCYANSTACSTKHPSSQGGGDCTASFDP